MTQRLKAGIGLAVGAIILFGAGFGSARLGAPPTVAATLASQASQFPLLSRTILADNSNDILINFVNLRNTLTADFNTLPAGTLHSFYFEYLPDGTSIKLGADNNLVAASLIKTPLVMNLFRAAELGKVNLDDTVTVTQSELDSGYGNVYLKGAGYKMTYRQAAEHALEESDDTAMHVIYDHVGNLLDYNDQSLAGLDIDQSLQNGQAVIDARAYTSVLKSLYFSSYLSNTDSETILGYLTKSTENGRLTKNIPSSVVVAHKNGVNASGNLSESDCGIVYVPSRPYAICVMVGLPYDQANPFIANVSKDVYDYVATQ